MENDQSIHESKGTRYLEGTWYLLILALILPRPLLGAEPSGKRTDQGYEISQDVYANVPSDMRIKKIANNVITPEADTDYLARKLSNFENEWNAFKADTQARISELEKKISELESKQRA